MNPPVLLQWATGYALGWTLLFVPFFVHVMVHSATYRHDFSLDCYFNQAHTPH